GGSNTCNGEPFVVDAKDANGNAVKLLLQSQPKGGSGLYDRRDVTIWYKEITDANYTSAQIASDWIQGLQVSTQQSAYSAMALQSDGKIAFFFEEAPCYGDDQAKGYCMVYVPLTIEAITKNQYSTLDFITSTIGEHEIGTFYANVAMTVPEGITAYVATQLPEMEGEEGTITMTALTDNIVPAKTGCVIRGAEGAYTFTKTETAGNLVNENLLRGYAGTAEFVEVTLPTDGSTNYVLTVMNETAGFYMKEAGFKVYNNKAYLNVPKGISSTIRLRFVDGDGTTDIVELPTVSTGATPIIYDLSGRRVEKATKGVYIVNGKKVVF
ncbi:MAG: exo-alpha-sialidase, partial [Bacteroidaceae bacterium]|nr:exo-alpha-sialidase [Bacteroidaceae bacterium]